MSTTSSASYAALLGHLYSKELKIPVSTLQGAISYHLAEVQPSPTSLTASTISGAYFTHQPFTYARLQTLATVFRHAVHLKLKNLRKEHEGMSMLSSVFGQGLGVRMSKWVREVVRGFQGGHPVLRLAGYTGVLLGLEDLRVEKMKEEVEKGGVEAGESRQKERVTVEAEVMVALAESLDAYPGFSSANGGVTTSWENEFTSSTNGTLVLVLLLASQSLPLVEESKLRALPLRLLIRLLVSTISSAFQDGMFLSPLSLSLRRTGDGIHISKESQMAESQRSLNSNVAMQSMAALSRVVARTLAVLLDHRPDEGIAVFSETLKVLGDLAARVEGDWCRSELANVAKEEDIAPDTREVTRSIWTTLKTLLFCIIMISEAGLSSIVFIPPRPTSTLPIATPQSLAAQSLYALFHLAFVITKFGGVTTTSVHSLTELKKAFYLAIDVISDGDQRDCEEFVEELSRRACDGGDSAALYVQARKAFVLAAVEQLVPVLGPTCTELTVFPICYPHLWDPSHRETFESAHSVILSVFAAHAEKTHQLGDNDRAGGGSRGGDHSLGYKTFIQKLVPFYVKCLIENSVDGGLETSQLCLAFSALVRSASASSRDGLIELGTPASTSSTSSSTRAPLEHYALSWYCIDQLLDAITEESHLTQLPNRRLFKLHLTLISTVSSLPLPLMVQTLEEIKSVIVKYPLPPSGASVSTSVESGEEAKSVGVGNGGKERTELVEALFEEVLEKVGDREKEEAIRWWYTHRDELVSGMKDVAREGRDENASWAWLDPAAVSKTVGGLVSQGKDLLLSRL